MEERLIPMDLVKEMKTAYGDYALAVLVGRAIPDLYDGMKPVTRRILTAMKWLNLKPDGKFMKSARVDGEVMGKLHPHGGAYGAMVTVAAPYNNNVPYINGHGNWGSPTDNAAAARYTECKLTEFSWNVLLDDFDICETRATYDGSFQEPIRLETKVPTALLNGVEGIGVGFATKVAPHNLKDICKAVEWVAKGNKKKAAECLIPDFPSGCDIVRDEKLKEYAVSGAGSIRLRARVEEGLEQRARSERVTLTFTNLPFQTNTESIGEQIKKGLEQGKISGVAEVRDESDREGDRLVVVLKPKVRAVDVVPYLYAYTDLSTSFPAKSLFVDGTKPVELAPYQVVERWLENRKARLVVKFTQEKEKKEARVHIIVGLLKAIDELDLVIGTIRKAKDKAEAKAKLMSNRTLKLSSEQAEAVLEMRLRQLTNLDTGDLQEEHDELMARIAQLISLIESEEGRTEYIVSEVQGISKSYGWARRSTLIDQVEEVAKAKTTVNTVKVPKLRFLKIDAKKGIVEQLRKPRGANIVTESDKIIFITDNGMVKKVPCTFKGPLYEAPTAVLSRATETEMKERKYLVVFELDEQLKTMCLKGEDLCRANSRGKAFIPEGAKLVYIGEDPYTVSFHSKRKKPVTLVASQVKEARPGAKGIKVASLKDLV
jgi:DNA gyrase subunit A